MQSRPTSSPSRRPERKWGPFHGGVSVCVWHNEVETDTGRRVFRSVSIGARRYRDANGEWKDAGSFQPTDLPALVLALQAAHDFMTATPLPGLSAQDASESTPTEPGEDDGPAPF